ncbi:hypothetical protein V5799_016110 [Amblyomma americanum]|uniref:Uncharacterized protein n=1 Tax=Amblyomma americanum TaxID=6943 RepID=A0AAQ4F754_AMBAM
MLKKFGPGSLGGKSAPGDDVLVEAGRTAPTLENTQAGLLRRYAEMVFEMDQRSLNAARAREQKMWLAAGAGLVFALLALMMWVSSLVFFATSRAPLPRIIHSLSPTPPENATGWPTAGDEVHAELFELMASRGSLQVSLEDAQDDGLARPPCRKNCSGKADLRREFGAERASDDLEDAVVASGQPDLSRDSWKTRISRDSSGPCSEDCRNSTEYGRDLGHKAAPGDTEPTFLDGWQRPPKAPSHARARGNLSRMCGETCNETTFVTKAAGTGSSYDSVLSESDAAYSSRPISSRA